MNTFIVLYIPSFLVENIKRTEVIASTIQNAFIDGYRELMDKEVDPVLVKQLVPIDYQATFGFEYDNDIWIVFEK